MKAVALRTAVFIGLNCFGLAAAFAAFTESWDSYPAMTWDYHQSSPLNSEVNIEE